MSAPTYDKERPETIQGLFTHIASDYDRANAIMSFSLHKWWNSTLIKKLTERPLEGQVTLLDLCCGTGEITKSYLKKHQNPHRVFALDFSEGMLAQAKMRLLTPEFSQHEITCIQGDAQNIPLEKCSVDRISVAYGIRNVRKPELCIQEAFRVLKPGGTFCILELTRPKFPPLRFLHRTYMTYVLPLVGKLVASDKEAYEYLMNSIQGFIAPSDLAQTMSDSGFQEVQCQALLGGIATIIQGYKPKTLTQKV
ncbi:MAG: bifunctional demethylmenaquinone methyltransferase/2-methoxy-6-polyprenyl-1,4-benzoquinol methylase UbiE [Waddliaceae bacterium]|nr:bifunctional demethylmenaquinone methyltransferase/2-methoxy-6-polyprenyl-1,4-benzoquinol methylase UbiE [Waddliaceae bacterium]